MKIAVCMSGQLRQWEIAKENQKWFWETSGVEIDYFIHTWDYSGDREGVSQPYVWRDISQEEFDKVIEWYKPKKYIFDGKQQTYFSLKFYLIKHRQRSIPFIIRSRYKNL